MNFPGDSELNRTREEQLADLKSQLDSLDRQSSVISRARAEIQTKVDHIKRELATEVISKIGLNARDVWHNKYATAGTIDMYVQSCREYNPKVRNVVFNETWICEITLDGKLETLFELKYAPEEFQRIVKTTMKS